jgi:peptidoglycan/xylan/chitin deacetylase (PgdA/CDA1 family)
VFAVAGALSAGAVLAGPPTAARAASAARPAAKYVYLTFDDGPNPPYTNQVLDLLAEYHARATFFEIGENVAKNPATTRRVHQRGQSVQNHTWSHPDLRKVSSKVFRAQVLDTDRVIRAQTGVTPTCLRPPYGAVDATVRSRAAALHKSIKLWTVDPRDWSRPGTSTIVHRVLDNVRPGSVVLMHDGGGIRNQTVAALRQILRTLKARGYSFRQLCP